MRLPIRTQADVERARREARSLARDLGLSREDAESVALAVSELATNLVRYAREGEVLLTQVDGRRGAGVEVRSHDRGPGIANVDQAMQDGFSTGGGLGGGLPGVRRLMDEFELETSPAGTTIVGRKWRASP